MGRDLTGSELTALVEGVFSPGPNERKLVIMVDMPDHAMPDNPAWSDRRVLASDWAVKLAAEGRFDVSFVAYRNPGMNNADLPATAWVVEPGNLPPTADDLAESASLPFSEVFSGHPMILAPTEFSATAPLKLIATAFGLRGATMPGFCREMVDALRLDYVEVNRRVAVMADLLDEAVGADFEFTVTGDGVADATMKLHLDLRHRMGHRSGGRFPLPGLVGNLPSGEAYIVPYEGEIEDDPSTSAGLMPVQFGNEVVVYRIADNRAVEVIGEGPAANEEREHLEAEPAYGNIAELGVGVLGDFGVKPLGEILIDEKLGLHIAFGRSDHFGGQVGPRHFSCPSAVIHIDRVYIPEMQPLVRVNRACLVLDDGLVIDLVRENAWVFAF